MPIKTASPDSPVLDVIRERWSPRAFDGQPVEPETLRSIVEAARWAPSSYNEQPWRYLVATQGDADAFGRMLSCLNERNRQWAAQAPVLMLACAKKHFSKSGKPNRHAWHDTGAATLSMALQATALGLHLHQMAGILPDRARVLYQIPDTFDVVTGIATGYLGDAAMLAETFQASERAPRSRRPLGETVFEEGWGQKASFV